MRSAIASISSFCNDLAFLKSKSCAEFIGDK